MSSTDETPTPDETAPDAAEVETPEVDAAEVVPAREPDPLRDPILEELASLVGDAIVETYVLPGKDMWVRVKAEAWAEVAHSVRYPLGARYFGFLSAMDWMPSPFGRSMDSEVDNLLAGKSPAGAGRATGAPEMTTGFAGGDTRFQVFARVANIKDHWGITLKADVGDEQPSIGTWTKVYAGADWHEREAWEMFGIDFVGHPGLRKIYLPADFEGHPLRKDFPLLARMVKPWPGIVDVEPMPGAGDDESSEESA